MSNRSKTHGVIAGLVRAPHPALPRERVGWVAGTVREYRDGRDKPGHDSEQMVQYDRNPL